MEPTKDCRNTTTLAGSIQTDAKICLQGSTASSRRGITVASLIAAASIIMAVCFPSGLNALFVFLVGDSSGMLSVDFSDVPPPTTVPDFELFGKDQPMNFKIARVRNFLSRDEIMAVHTLARLDSSVLQIHDRDDSLAHSHQAYRMEIQLRTEHPELYERLLNYSWAIDSELWTNIATNSTLYPEIEYIDYNVEELGRHGSIAPHVDNFSLVSVIVLLTQPFQFEGGLNFFAGSSDILGGEAQDREVELRLGDAVFFHGDKCKHWISPVTSGWRAVLQMELSTAPTVR